MIKKIMIFFLSLFLISNEQEIEKIRKRLDELRGKELGALEEIEKIDYEIILMEKEIEDLRGKERFMLELSKKKERELDEARRDFEREKDKLKSFFYAIYMFRYFNPLEILLTKPKDLTFTDLTRIIYISNLSKEKINQLEQKYERLKNGEEELRKARINYQKAIKEKESKLSELNAKKREKRKFVENIGLERDKYISLLKEMEKASEEISKTISRIEPSKFPIEFVPIRERKGFIPWPVEGRVVSKFGLVKNKKYNTFVRNIGVVLSPLEKDVKAVWWGKVIFADYFEGYGKVVIIEHQDRVYTIYGYLGTILVKKGEEVRTGQVIAKIGSSGLTGEEALYFEIREGNEPKNPLLWLSNK